MARLLPLALRHSRWKCIIRRSQFRVKRGENRRTTYLILIWPHFTRVPQSFVSKTKLGFSLARHSVRLPPSSFTDPFSLSFSHFSYFLSPSFITLHRLFLLCYLSSHFCCFVDGRHCATRNVRRASAYTTYPFLFFPVTEGVKRLTLYNRWQPLYTKSGNLYITVKGCLVCTCNCNIMPGTLPTCRGQGNFREQRQIFGQLLALLGLCM